CRGRSLATCDGFCGGHVCRGHAASLNSRLSRRDRAVRALLAGPWEILLGGLRRSLQHLVVESSMSGWVRDRRCAAEPGGRGVAAMVALSTLLGDPEQLGHLLGRLEPPQRLARAAVEPRRAPGKLGPVIDRGGRAPWQGVW